MLCAAGLFGAVIAAVHHAEVVAHRVGEPFGTPVPATAGTVVAAAECRLEEPLQPTRVVTFSLIRAGLFVFGWSAWRKTRSPLNGVSRLSRCGRGSAGVRDPAEASLPESRT